MMIAPRSICTAACVAAHSRIARNALRFSNTPDYAPIKKLAVGITGGETKEPLDTSLSRVLAMTVRDQLT